MRFFLISDNSDAMNGLRLAGIEGTVARSEADLRHALADAANQPDIAVLLVTEKIAETYTATLDSTPEYYKKRPCPELCRIAADIMAEYIAAHPK